MCKISRGISLKFMQDLVEEFDTKYHTRSLGLDEDNDVKNLNKRLNYRSQKPNTSSFGLESFRWLGPKIWELIPDNVKHAKSLSAFKNALRKLNIAKCPFKLCIDYIHGVSYLN